ncbi:histidine kinase, partial [Streptomyces sp. NPDC049040]
GQYPVQQGQGGPGDTAQFPAVRADDTFGGGTGQYPQPGGRPQGGPGHRDGGAPQQPYDTGRQQMPGQERSDVTGQHPMAPQPGMQGGPGLPGAPEPIGPFQQRPGQQPLQQQPAEPMALPPAPTRGDEPTPIFSAIESDWFRTGQAERMQQIHVEQSARGQQAPSAPRPVGRTAPPQRPRTERPSPAGPQRPGSGASQQQAPQPAPAPTAAAPAAPAGAPPAPAAQPLPRETPNWRTSPNDALRQRAEAVREPSAGGVTPSGLPRRVPRANLVAGGATQQQPQQGGPQVSRSPDDVRGRLTNLRRGIQQGREAGGTTDGRGFGTNHQER